MYFLKRTNILLKIHDIYAYRNQLLLFKLVIDKMVVNKKNVFH